MSNLLSSSLLRILILVGVFLRLSVTVLCVCVRVCFMRLLACIYPHIVDPAIPLEPVANAYQTF